MIDVRRLPAALGLGLPAALLAHLVTFGGRHSAGGAFHDVLGGLAASLVAGSLAAAVALAWSGARAIANGSVLAERLRRFTPSYGQLLAASCAAFWMIEWLEPRHGHPLAPFAAPALLLTAWAIRAIVGALLRLLAAIAVAIACAGTQAPAAFALRFVEITPSAVRAPLRGRHFARPPPIRA